MDWQCVMTKASPWGRLLVPSNPFMRCQGFWAISTWEAIGVLRVRLEIMMSRLEVAFKNGFAKRYAAGGQVFKTFGDIACGRIFSHDLAFGIDALMDKRKYVLDLRQTFDHLARQLGDRGDLARPVGKTVDLHDDIDR